MKHARRFLVGVIIANCIMAIVIAILLVVGFVSWQLEELAQDRGFYGPDNYGQEDDEGMVFIISFLIILISLIAGVAYSYGRNDDEVS